jgi:heptaprenyl diphosphate synthase
MKKDTRKIVTLGLLAALSLAIYAFESVLPPLLPIPGMKPGLSNIIILYTLKRFGKKEAGSVLLVRLLLSAILFGNAISLIYSAAGGFLALLIEILCDKILSGKNLQITGAFGGLFHNIAQLIIAMLIMQTGAVFSYAPYLFIAGIVTGLFTGFASHFLLKIKIPET